MALLGQGARPAAIDYSSWAASAERMANTQANAFSSVAGAISDLMEDRKVKKDQIKVSADLLKAYETLYGNDDPKRAEAFKGISEALKDEEMPLSQRAAYAAQVGELIGMDQQRQKDAAAENRFMKNYLLDKAQTDLAVETGRENLNAAKADRAKEQQNLADNEEVQSLVAPNVLLNVFQQTQALEKAGQPVMIPSSQLQQVLQTGTTHQKMALAQAALSGFPQEETDKINFNTPITINGQSAEAATRYNPKTRSLEIIPVVQSGPVNGLPEALAPYAADFEAAGATHGVDPKLLAAIAMHETGKGTSSAFRTKNNAMGISDSKGPTAQASVPASIDRMAKLIGSRTSGPYKNADTIDEIAKIYAPPGAGNDPRGLNKHWVDGVAKYYAELGGDPRSPVKITPGAVKGGTTKTPTEQALDEARLKKLGAELENKEADLAKQTDAKATAKASAENALTLIDQLRKHPGFTSAVGVSLTPGFLPATDRKGAESIIDQLKGQAFLTAIQQLRGLGALSDAEGAKLQQAAVRLDASQSEKDFMIALSDYEKQIREALGRLGGASAQASPAADYSSRLRSLK